MARANSWYFLLCSSIVTAGVLGCSQPAASNKEASAKVAPEAAQDDAEEAAEIATAIALLPEAERPLAIAQKICPVGGGPLGAGGMGMPYKVTVNGRDVYLCCEGCKGAIEKDPEKYLAKLDAQAK